MTNEKILRIFLKKHRLYSYFKRNKGIGLKNIKKLRVKRGEVSITLVIAYLFIWSRTKQGHWHWDSLSMKWNKLCKDFNLTGTINLNKV